MPCESVCVQRLLRALAEAAPSLWEKCVLNEPKCESELDAAVSGYWGGLLQSDASLNGVSNDMSEMTDSAVVHMRLTLTPLQTIFTQEYRNSNRNWE